MHFPAVIHVCFFVTEVLSLSAFCRGIKQLEISTVYHRYKNERQPRFRVGDLPDENKKNRKSNRQIQEEEEHSNTKTQAQKLADGAGRHPSYLIGYLKSPGERRLHVAVEIQQLLETPPQRRLGLLEVLNYRPNEGQNVTRRSEPLE